MGLDHTLQLRSSEVLDHILPVRWVVVAAEVRLKLATENLQRSTLANTVGTNESKDLSGSRHRQSVELEAVGRVAMRDLSLEIGRKVDDGDGVKRAFLRADTTTNAETLRYEGNLGFRRHFDTELAGTDDRARPGCY